MAHAHSHPSGHPSTAGEPLYVDVRSPGEYAGGHIEGALNMPLPQLQGLLLELAPDRSREIVLYCTSGARSAHACALLHVLGYSRARNGGAIGTLALTSQRALRRA